jgi:Serine/threonine protein phosphatase
MDAPAFREMEGKLFVVADGLGGHAKGETASYEVLRVLSELEPFDEKSLNDALWKAKESLLDYVKKEPSAFGLGTALAGVILGDKDIIVFNVGDCRVYLKKDGDFVKVSRDHTLVEDLIIAGKISEEDARFHPQRHVLTSAILGDYSDFELYTKRIPKKETALLICSDGFWEEFSKEEMRFFASLEEPVDAIFQALKEKPQRDNVSFIYLKL